MRLNNLFIKNRQKKVTNLSDVLPFKVGKIVGWSEYNDPSTGIDVGSHVGINVGTAVDVGVIVGIDVGSHVGINVVTAVDVGFIVGI